MYKNYFKKNLTENKMSMYSKLFALCYGIISLAVAFLAQFLGGVLQASLTIFGVVGGPLLGIFSLGMFTSIPNEKVDLICSPFSFVRSLMITFTGIACRFIDRGLFVVMDGFWWTKTSSTRTASFY